ncbi:hypothetical protein FRB99_007545 [Tulasnella sp. 403]|nr:hypothetical protein FRB99_007545 [Tulasnella sp. 403]
MALPTVGPASQRRSSWSSPSRREFAFVAVLFVILVFLFESDLSLRFTTQSANDWNWNYSDRKEEAKITPTIDTAGDSDELTMNDARISWDGNQMPQTVVVQHTQGFNILDNLYSLNGTMYIVTDKPKSIPPLRLITSSAYPVFNGEEEVAKREPTSKDMRVISPKDARKLFGSSAGRVEGVTFLSNDPPQFVNHYYHFCAELLFGMWRAYSSLDPTIKSTGQTVLPPPRRMIFTHTPEDKFRDYAKMNQWVFHSAFPSASLEFSEDWEDRSETLKPFFFDRVVFGDRAAAMRGKAFVATERFASTAFELPGSAKWFEPLRSNVVEFAGLSKTTGAGTRQKPVITYVSRQSWGRRMLKPEDHEGLVKALKKLEKEHGYEVNIVEMDKLTREEQFQLAGRTTIMMGVHGNGLTSLIWMHPTPRAAVFEFFYPSGFAEDYEWTARALGIRHYGWWGSSYFSSPDLPPRSYPEGFQGNDIPIDGEAVARLVLHQLSLNEEADD